MEVAPQHVGKDLIGVWIVSICRWRIVICILGPVHP